MIANARLIGFTSGVDALVKQLSRGCTGRLFRIVISHFPGIVTHSFDYLQEGIQLKATDDFFDPLCCISSLDTRS